MSPFIAGLLTAASLAFTHPTLPDTFSAPNSALTAPPADKQLVAHSSALPDLDGNPATLVSTAIADTSKPVPAPARLASFTLQKSAANLNADLVFDLINSHRQSLGKPPFQKDQLLCDIAQSRAPELAPEIYGDRPVHAGIRERDLDFRVTENVVTKPTESAVVAWWLNSPIHRQAIESDHTHSCGACQGTACVQLFTSWQPR